MSIPMFRESEDAYMKWTGEDMGKTEPSDKGGDAEMREQDFRPRYMQHIPSEDGSDLISRANALAYPLSFDHYDKENGSREFICGVESYREYIQHLPSVSAERVGEWIWCGDKGDSRFMCSVCKSKENVPTCMGEPSVWDYCPNCGARMKGGDDK